MGEVCQCGMSVINMARALYQGHFVESYLILGKTIYLIFLYKMCMNSGAPPKTVKRLETEHQSRYFTGIVSL